MMASSLLLESGSDAGVLVLASAAASAAFKSLSAPLSVDFHQLSGASLDAVSSELGGGVEAPESRAATAAASLSAGVELPVLSVAKALSDDSVPDEWRSGAFGGAGTRSTEAALNNVRELKEKNLASVFSGASILAASPSGSNFPVFNAPGWKAVDSMAQESRLDEFNSAVGAGCDFAGSASSRS